MNTGIDQCSSRISSNDDDHLITINDGDHDAWLPITESRNGNVYSCSFHIICSSIGFQALLLPLAFASLGWAWGMTCLSIAFSWQLYTLWLLVNLHESQPDRTRYSRYLHLAISCFGAKTGKALCVFPVMYLSGGSCVMLIITGGEAINLFLHTAVSEPSPLSRVVCFLLFTCVAISLAQLPNLNSIAAVSFVGAITGVAYCALILIFSIDKPGSPPKGLSFDPSHLPVWKSEGERICAVLNGIGIIALAFRGHNIILEIQGTIMSSTTGSKHASKAVIIMRKAVIISYMTVATCIYPLAIVGYWAYGNQMATNGGGLLGAFSEFHGQTTSKFTTCTIYLLFFINCLTTFPIFAMPVFDNFESIYTRNNNKRCPAWLRPSIRVLFGGFTFFIATTFPFLGKLAGLIGGMALPLTFAYPCFMWIAMKRSSKYGAVWLFNVGLGCLGLVLSVVCVSAAIWNLALKGLHANFFSP